MARPISYGLVLEGQDAKDFEDYMENPTFSERSLLFLKKVKRDMKKRGYIK